MNNRRFQIASDLERDGMGLELLDEAGDVVAEVFSSDRDRVVTLSTYGNDIELSDVERLIRTARARLGAFEDGAPWPSAED